MLGKMEIIPLMAPLIAERDDLTQVLLNTLNRMKLALHDGDIIVVASKVVALVEERVRKASDVKVTDEASRLAKKLDMSAALTQLILEESDVVFQGSQGFVLTERKGFPCVNACIDAANSPEGTFILPPADSDRSAWHLREEITKRIDRRVAVVVADSGLIPGRRGTIGVALGSAGLKPSKSYVGRNDLYGRPFRVTYQSVIDDLASAAKLLMGEGDERIPFVLIRGAPVEYTDTKVRIESTLLPPSACIFMSNLARKKSG